MTNSSLEITENQYCIKLNKNTFDLSLVRQLIKRIAAEEQFFSGKNETFEDDIISRNSAHNDGNFDRLEDK